MSSDVVGERFYLGALSLFVGAADAAKINDLVLIVAPDKETATLVLESHKLRFCEVDGLMVECVCLTEVPYSVAAVMTPHLVMLNPFAQGECEVAWSRELIVPVCDQGAKEAPASVRTVWTARELKRVAMLMAVARSEKMTQARQYMAVEWLDAVGNVVNKRVCSTRSEIVLRPFENLVALVCCGGEGERHSETRSEWFDYRVLSRLLETGSSQVAVAKREVAARPSVAVV